MKSLAALNHDQSPEWLLAFDFDGTLVDSDTEEPIDPHFFDLIRSLRDSDRIVWGVNTGRTLMHTVEGILQAEFPFLPDFLIVREREIYTPNAFGRWVPDDSWNRNCSRAHARLFLKHKPLLLGIRRWVEAETAAVWGFQEAEPDGIVAKTPSEMDEIVAYIDAQIENAAELSYQRNSIYLRFSHANYHKGTAMREVARQLGCGTERTFAIGDGHNDLDMLNLAMACHLACPANACDDVRQQVDRLGGYVSEAAASKGVVEALTALFREHGVEA